jgi:hypothetical protein
MGPQGVAELAANRGFRGVAAYGSDDQMTQLAQFCRQNNLECWSWVGAMYYDSQALPEWDYNTYHPDKLTTPGKLIYVGDLLPDREAVINHIVSKCTRLLDRYPGTFAGLMLDYCRSYQEAEMWADGIHWPRTDIQDHHVTEVFDRIHNAMAGRRIISSVIPSAPSSETGLPHNQVNRQRWDEWIRAGKLEAAHQMAYTMLPSEVGLYIPESDLIPQTGIILRPTMTDYDINTMFNQLRTTGMIYPPSLFELSEIRADWPYAEFEQMDLYLIEEKLREIGQTDYADEIQAMIDRVKEIDDELDAAALIIEVD